MDRQFHMASFYLEKEPFYQPVAQEVALFKAAYASTRPVAKAVLLHTWRINLKDLSLQ